MYRAIAILTVALFFCSAGMQCCCDSFSIRVGAPQAIIAGLHSSSFSATGSHRVVQQISIPGFASASSSGNPALPCKLLYVALPLDADENSIKVSPGVINAGIISGDYEIPPVPPAVISDSDGRLDNDEQTLNARNMQVYGRDEFYPPEHLKLRYVGKLRNMKIAAVEYWPYCYNPKSGKLRYLECSDAMINFTASQSSVQSVNDSLTLQMAGFVSNKEQAAVWYPSNVVASAPKPGYVIMTTSAIASDSSRITDFIDLLTLRGFNPMVITESNWGGGTGDTAALNIRNWLKANYISKNIEYVLLIGNANPTNGIVPMKMLWPRNSYSSYKEAPSDYYYADLTGNWDRDGDGYSGEEPDDFGTGGIDRIPEVYVGRIPYYGSIVDLDYILQKMINYETTTLPDWRRKVLLPMKPLDSYTQSYEMGESIVRDILAPQGFIPVRIYDSIYGLNPAPEYYPCDYGVVESEWLKGAGFVFWQTHGSSTAASNILTSSLCPDLNDVSLPIVYAGSCTNGKPEDSTNLGYSLLKSGAISTLSASRVAWYYIGESNYTGSDSIGGVGYQYAKCLIQYKESCGRAVIDAKLNVPLTIWPNHLVLNIYGDPSLVFGELAPGAVSGKVTTVNGAPIPNAVIQTLDGNQSTLSQSDGSYALYGLAPGSQDIVIYANGSYPQHFYSAPIESGKRALIDFHLVQCTAGSLSGTVKNTQGNPVSGAAISVSKSTSTAYTAQDGSYRLDDLSPGFYALTVSKPPYAQKIVTGCEVKAGLTANADVTLAERSSNALLNGGFESGFTNQIANHWQFYISRTYFAGPVGDMQYYHSGTFSQKIHLPQPTMANGHSGFYQVANVVPGSNYTLTAWSRDSFAGVENGPSDNVVCRVGYDPMGNTDYSSSSVIWTTFTPGHNAWRSISTTVAASSQTITIFLDSCRKLIAGGDDCYAWFDDVSLVGPVQAPAVPVIQADRYQSNEAIQASWSSSDMSALSYEYAISKKTDGSGIIPGGSWTACANTHISRNGLALQNGDVVYVLVRAINEAAVASETGVSEPIRIVQDVTGIAFAKQTRDGAWIRVRDVYAARMGEGPECFVQDTGQASGIKATGLWGDVPYLLCGTKVTIAGNLTTLGGTRALSNADVMPSAIESAVRPVTMSNSSIGGANLLFADDSSTVAQIGSPWGRGCNNVGMLVTTFGRVTAVTSDGFTITDGSIQTGLPVRCLVPVSAPAVGSFVQVTGIAAPYELCICSANDIYKVK